MKTDGFLALFRKKGWPPTQIDVGNFAACLAPDFEGAPRSRYLPDSRISREDKLTRAQCGLFEILRLDREDLPAGHRYEAMINRQLDHAIAELERVQARKKGEAPIANV